jgi:hypothetical protein
MGDFKFCRAAALRTYSKMTIFPTAGREND